jgi:hypothetical protein
MHFSLFNEFSGLIHPLISEVLITEGMRATKNSIQRSVLQSSHSALIFQVFSRVAIETSVEIFMLLFVTVTECHRGESAFKCIK